MNTPESLRIAYLFPTVGAAHIDRFLTYEETLQPGEVQEPGHWHTPPSLARTLLVDEEPVVLEPAAFTLLVRKLLPGDRAPTEIQEMADLVHRIREVYPGKIPEKQRTQALEKARADEVLEQRLREVLDLYDRVRDRIQKQGWMDLPALYARVIDRLRHGELSLPYARLVICGMEHVVSPLLQKFIAALKDAFPKQMEVHRSATSAENAPRYVRFADDREEVAALVHTLHTDPPRRPHRVLVGLVEFGQDYPLVEQALTSGGIPFRRLGGRPLHHYPAFQAILQLLRLLEDRDAAWSEVYGVLLDPSFALLSMDDRRRLMAARPGEDAPLMQGSDARSSWETWFRTKRFPDRVIGVWNALAHAARWSETAPVRRVSAWVRLVQDLLARLQWLQHPADPEARRLRERVERLLLEMTFLDEWLDLPEMTVQEFRRWLEHLAGAYTIPEENDPETAGGIWVGRFPDHVPRTLDRVYVLGVTDRAYPRLPSDLILPYEVQEALGLLSPAAYYQREKERFVQALRRVQDVVWISVPERKGETWVAPAPFLLAWTHGTIPSHAAPIQWYVRDHPRSGKLLGDVVGETWVLEGEALDAWRTRLQEKGLNVTEVARAASCGYRYYLERVEGVPFWWVPRWRPEPVDVGTLAHELLQKIFKAFLEAGQPAPAPEEVAKRFRARVEEIPDDHLGDPSLAELARTRLLNFVPIIQRQEASLRVRQVSRTVDVEVSRNAPIEVEGLRIPLRGRLDRVLEDEEGNIQILDYKTGRKKERLVTGDGPKEREYRLQAGGYALLEPRARTVLFSFLSAKEEEDPLVELGVTPELTEEFRDMLAILARGVFLPADDAWTCASCDHRVFCPFVREGHG
ncbi:MAG: PD-(D/E)XK nuclease family protein [Candidatus Hydrothermae bacterium]|nr:PD-(D/E)XK nuclease family protein [Candidatus Hydrothermae bacterium]